MAKKDSAIARHMKTIQTGEVTKTVVIGIRKAFNAYELAIARRENPDQSWDELESVLTVLADVKPLVTGELKDSGVAMLTAKRYRKQLESVSHIIDDIACFKLVGFDQVEQGGHVLKAYPVYRCYNHSGKSFPFRVIPWQAGGHGPEILSGNYW